MSGYIQKWNPPTKEESWSQLSYSLKWVTRSERSTPQKGVSKRLGTMERPWNMNKTIVALCPSCSTPARISICSCHLQLLSCPVSSKLIDSTGFLFFHFVRISFSTNKLYFVEFGQNLFFSFCLQPQHKIKLCKHVFHFCLSHLHSFSIGLLKDKDQNFVSLHSASVDIVQKGCF